MAKVKNSRQPSRAKSKRVGKYLAAVRVGDVAKIFHFQKRTDRDAYVEEVRSLGVECATSDQGEKLNGKRRVR